MPNIVPLELESTFFLTHAIKQELSNQLEHQKLNIAPMHIRVLNIIQKKQNCTAIDITRLFKRDKAQITRLVTQLIDRGYIQKKPNPEDKRSQFLVLSTQGQELQESLVVLSGIVVQKMAQNIDPKELEVFIKVAKEMTKNLSWTSRL